MRNIRVELPSPGAAQARADCCRWQTSQCSGDNNERPRPSLLLRLPNNDNKSGSTSAMKTAMDLYRALSSDSTTPLLVYSFDNEETEWNNEPDNEECDNEEAEHLATTL